MLRIGRTVMPGVFRSTSRKLMPACFFTVLSVRTSMNMCVPSDAPGGPGLLAVDDEVVAVEHRLGAQAARSEPAFGSE